MESVSELSPREVEPSLTELSESILCPILQTPMRDPVIAADGHSYERAAIEQWIAQRGARAVSPLTGARLAHLELASNITLKVIIKTYLSSLPLRHTKELSQKDLALAIQLREEELSNQLAKQHKKLEQLSSVEERLGPMEEENQRLRKEIERLNSKPSRRMNDNDNIVPTVLAQSVVDEAPEVEKYLSDIRSLSVRLSGLNQAHSANMIKRKLGSYIAQKKLNQTRLIKQEEDVLHQLEVSEQQLQQRQQSLLAERDAGLGESEQTLKMELAEIQKEIVKHSGEEGNDDAVEKLVARRRELRSSHDVRQQQLKQAHETKVKQEAERTEKEKQQKKSRLQEIRGSKSGKQRELNRWSVFVEKQTQVIELQRESLSKISLERTSKTKALNRYSEEKEIHVSKLLIARREQDAKHQEAIARETEAKRLAELSPANRVNQKAQSVTGRVTKEEISELFKFTIRGQLEEVRACLRQNRDLAHVQYDLTDLSERTFPQITGFQYAVWCGDWELWDVFLEFMTEAEAYDQLITLLKERPDITQKHGTLLSFFDPLLTAYQRYLDFLNQKNWQQCGICWIREVGGAQRNMPAWFIYMFSEEGEDKAWPKQQMDRGFSRKSEHIKTWFVQEYNNGKCGVTFAFYRSSYDACAGKPGGGPGCLAPHDLHYSDRLKTECTKKLAVLTERLSKSVKNESNLPPPPAMRKKRYI